MKIQRTTISLSRSDFFVYLFFMNIVLVILLKLKMVQCPKRENWPKETKIKEK